MLHLSILMYRVSKFEIKFRFRAMYIPTFQDLHYHQLFLNFLCNLLLHLLYIFYLHKTLQKDLLYHQLLMLYDFQV